MREREGLRGAAGRALVLLVLALGAGWPVQAAGRTPDEENTIAVFRRLAPGVVYITTLFAQEGPAPAPARRGVGSGFVVSPEGHVLTNAHVVEGSEDIRVALPGHERRRARLIGLDAATDVAVLQIENPPPDLTVIPLGTSTGLEIGQKVLAIGNPFGLSQTLTVGVVSGLERFLPTSRETVAGHVIQTDAAINVGNSGGPLLTSDGQAVGVNTAIIQGAQSIAFAIPIDTVKAVLPQLLREGRVIRPWIGISGKFVDEGLRKVFNVPLTSGFLVEDVGKGSPAERADIREGTLDVTVNGVRFLLGGDIITQVNDQPIRTSEDFFKALAGLHVGAELRLTLFRDGQTLTKTLTLAERPR
ncbi:MAG: trypsin-like peptidase domain-containing protein [candidate division NC10 bacterium]|nr:trypsin-like peptidase domain-containing protein [candidate division NC10 bacterium]